MDAEEYLEPMLDDEIVKWRLMSAGFDPEEVFSFLRRRWNILLLDPISRHWDSITKEEGRFLAGIEIIHNRQIELEESMKAELDWDGEED